MFANLCMVSMTKWWCYPSEDGVTEALHRGPTVGPRPQGLDQRSKMEEVPKIARWRGSDAGQSRRRLWCLPALLHQRLTVFRGVGRNGKTTFPRVQPSGHPQLSQWRPYFA